jgi:ABC-type lipoprotein export system ATPase subunit
MSSATTSGDPIIDVRGLSKSFEGGRIPALRGADLRVQAGEFVALVGPSGCGKSTLLHLIAALDLPDDGTIRVAGHDLVSIHQLNHYRSRDVGIIFQLHNLLPSLTASENVQVPMFEAGYSAKERRERATRLLSLVGLAGKERQRPTELSGGERQRVAIARALANDPQILLADEPTGSLDSVAGQRILDLLDDIRARRNLTVLLVTHDPTVAARADRVVRMLDGRIVEQNVVAPASVNSINAASPSHEYSLPTARG